MENDQSTILLRARRASTVLEFLLGVSNRPVAEPLALLADGFAYSVVPSRPTSWRLTSPPLNKATFGRHLAGLFPIFASLRMSPADMLEDETSGSPRTANSSRRSKRLPTSTTLPTSSGTRQATFCWILKRTSRRTPTPGGPAKSFGLPVWWSGGRH